MKRLGCALRVPSYSFVEFSSRPNVIHAIERSETIKHIKYYGEKIPTIIKRHSRFVRWVFFEEWRDVHELWESHDGSHEYYGEKIRIIMKHHPHFVRWVFLEERADTGKPCESNDDRHEILWRENLNNTEASSTFCSLSFLWGRTRYTQAMVVKRWVIWNTMERKSQE